MKKRQSIAILSLILLLLFLSKATDDQRHANPPENESIITAYKNKQSDLLVLGKGVVIKKLPDDLQGSRHQRFIVRIETNHTILIAHNIDLAPRVPVKQGSEIAFSGEYEWNKKGGVVHWTHHDPKGKHQNGWIEVNGKRYQ